MTRKKKTKPVLCAEAEFEASMTHTSVQSLFQGLGLIQDGAKQGHECEGEDPEPRYIWVCICLALWQQPSCYCCTKPHFVAAMGASSSSDQR